MEQKEKDFIRYDFIGLLKNANPFTAAKWGRMNFQQMVEHLVLAVKNANGNIKTAKVFTPPDKIEASHQFLLSNKEFRENTKSPAFPEDPLPLHFKTVEEGISKLEKEIGNFFTVYENNPGILILNPVFGDLDYDLAQHLLYKHFRHHAKQFGLID